MLTGLLVACSSVLLRNKQNRRPAFDIRKSSYGLFLRFTSEQAKSKTCRLASAGLLKACSSVIRRNKQNRRPVVWHPQVFSRHVPPLHVGTGQIKEQFLSCLKEIFFAFYGYISDFFAAADRYPGILCSPESFEGKWRPNRAYFDCLTSDLTHDPCIDIQ